MLYRGCLDERVHKGINNGLVFNEGLCYEMG